MKQNDQYRGGDLDRNDGLTALIEEARAGSEEALGNLIESVRTYLLLVANQETDDQLRAKVAASDVVQDACLRAHQGFGAFRGSTVEELRAWMRQVLLNSLSDLRRKHVQSKKRDAAREVAAEHDKFLHSPELTPKSSALAREEGELLREAMSVLSEDHRLVLQLRNWELLSFIEIGARMGRSDEAVRKLWSRALRELEKELRRMA